MSAISANMTDLSRHAADVGLMSVDMADLLPTSGRHVRLPDLPTCMENVFRGTFRVKKRDLPAKSGTVGRAHIEICLEVYSPQKSIMFQNTL